ncbi:hypothetical protein DMW05_23835 [Vibrio parahaemolyticus]|nr:hypothetical protein [Vibrio parahaemolyticus]EGR2933671.1 hypothetical protein [Vibrio parahaemolyticus]EGR2958222.1 hypothetical protein [Vibrio parahaemolyticus]EGR2963074.1 hypothetical protein [Vibrio parahaemolyticus]EGR2968010.1 hypothetical protein [Vibrio parahaemolyticus]
MVSKKLPVTLKDVPAGSYLKPERRNELVEDSKYDDVDNAVGEGVKIGSNGVEYVDEDHVPNLVQENAGDAQYLVDTLIPERHKRTIGNRNLIHSSALVGLLDERSQETRSASKQALQQYARDSLINVGDSDQAQKIRRDLDDFNAKEQKKLRKSRNSEVDEITGEPLEKGYAFHHKNQKSLHTDPEQALDPDAGVLVNDSTHKEIHKRKLRNEKALEEYKKELERKKK